MEYITCVILFISALVAVVTDLKTGLIKNWLTLPLWAAGLIIGFLENGIFGIGAAFGAGLLVVVTTFKFSTPGGGDIKLGMAIGSWIGTAGWPAYFMGSALTRVFLSLAVKLKIYGAKGFVNGLKYECLTGIVPASGDKSFQIFQNAAKKAGGNPDMPSVPGALWTAGGVLGYIVYSFIK